MSREPLIRARHDVAAIAPSADEGRIAHGLFRCALTIAAALALPCATLTAQNVPPVPAVRIAARQAYRDDGFGIFIRWGVNIGPRPDGTIQPEAVERLHALGAWLQVYGPTIYRTRGGPIPPRVWGATTHRGDTVFVHVLNWPDRELALPDFGARVVRASAFDGGATVPVAQTANGTTLTLPPARPGDPDQIMVLVTRRSP